MNDKAFKIEIILAFLAFLFVAIGGVSMANVGTSWQQEPGWIIYPWYSLPLFIAGVALGMVDMFAAIFTLVL